MSGPTMMRFAGDRMMTHILSRLRSAGVREITLTPDLRIIRVKGRRWPNPICREDMANGRALARVTLLLSSDAPEPHCGGRTFREALRFRTERMFSASEGGPVTILPSLYEARLGDIR